VKKEMLARQSFPISMHPSITQTKTNEDTTQEKKCSLMSDPKRSK
jgi:hypothetical protein